MDIVLNKTREIILLITICLISSCSKENVDNIENKQISEIEIVQDEVVEDTEIEVTENKRDLSLETIDGLMNHFFTLYDKSIVVVILDKEEPGLMKGYVKYKPDGSNSSGLGSGHLSFHLLHVIETPESKEYYFTYTLLEGGIDETNALFFKAVVSLDDFKETLKKYEANEIKYFDIEVLREELGNKYPDYLPAVKMPWDE